MTAHHTCGSVAQRERRIDLWRQAWEATAKNPDETWTCLFEWEGMRPWDIAGWESPPCASRGEAAKHGYRWLQKASDDGNSAGAQDG